MRPLAALSLAAVFAAALAVLPLTGSARAEDPPAGGAGKPGASEPVKPGEKGGKASPAQPTRLERAKRLVQELETTVTLLKATRTADPETLKALEKALEDARALAKPITLEELTEDEKRALGEELKKENGGDKDGKGDGGGAPGDEWRKNALAGAFKDADLTEDEEIEAKKIISEWFDKNWAAVRAGESKRVSDLKRDRDEKLEKSLGRKKAQKVVNNLNAMGPGRR